MGTSGAMNVVLHTCCGPCASACVPRLKDAGHAVTMYFSNSNLDSREEYERRLAEARKVADSEGVELEADVYDHGRWLREVATGYEVRYIIGSTVIRTVMVIVRGDLNADGRVNSVDYMMLKRFAMGNYELDEIGLYAALLTPREVPCAVDYIMLKLYVLDKFEL